jgi:hypothetical protein
MSMQSVSSQFLAAAITRLASKQTYYTIRYLVDRDRTGDAFRAYAYFRWVDDWLDRETGSKHERLAFIKRQKELIEDCYLGLPSENVTAEERLLVDLIQGNGEKDSGLECYIQNMMALMSFDTERRGRLITQDELGNYTRWLATAVTEAMHYFIGHGCASPHNEARYLAVSAAHITHMLRDTYDDIAAGYYNIPEEIVGALGIDPLNPQGEAYREWVRQRVQQAQVYFEVGKDYLAQVENPRCRLAGYAYTARFESILNAIEQDGYQLRTDYSDLTSPADDLRMGWTALGQTFSLGRSGTLPHALSVR